MNTDKQLCQGERKKMNEESPEPGKRSRDFVFLQQEIDQRAVLFQSIHDP